MEYISTRGSVPPIASKKAIIKGIAEDNGLYVPSSFPFIGPNPFAALLQKSYAARAEKVLQLFLTDFTDAEIRAACKGAYADNFDSPLTAPVQFLDHGTAVLELWHGPTLAFKDIALQLMPRLLSMALQGERERYKVAILVATSGDTGKAALEGFADAEGVSIFVFYPHKGVSEMQRLQMVTQRGGNVGACGVIGNFDDAQTGVKKIFSEPEINVRLETFHLRLSSANSINWGRLAPQVVYYFTAYEEMVSAGTVRRGQPINICVPTGNFGNILGAYYAIRSGLPVSRLICASNRNNVLADFIRTGIYDRRREFYKTESPSMDILISSNLERLLFELAGRNSSAVSEWMNKLAAQGWYAIPGNALDQLQSLFYGGFADHVDTASAVKETFAKHGYLLDPHSAVGYSVLRKYQEETGDTTPVLLVSTASPFKFNQAVLEALGWDTSKRDEFSLLKELSSLWGQPVPFKLAELKSLPEIHKDVCEKQEMAGALYKFLGIA
jgi:threonine synthase